MVTLTIGSPSPFAEAPDGLGVEDAMTFEILPEDGPTKMPDCFGAGMLLERERVKKSKETCLTG
jgi:hypothetical protein